MEKKADTVSWIAADLAASYAPDRVLLLQLEGCVIKIQSNSTELIQRLSEYYRGFIGGRTPDLSVMAFETDEPVFGHEFIKKEPEPGKTRIKEEYFDLKDGRIVRKLLTGMHFVFGRGINIAVGKCVDNYNQVVNFINNRYIESMLKSGCMLFHSAGVVLKSKGLAIAGFAGKGKSTLALNLVGRGMKFLSNDRVMVKSHDGGVTMYGIPKLPRINPGTVLASPMLKSVIPEKERAEFESIHPDKLWELEHKYDVDIAAIFGADRFVLTADLMALVIINWDRESGAPFALNEVDLERRLDLVRAYMKSPGLFFEMSGDITPPDFSERAFVNVMKNVRVYEITGSVNFDEAADQCIGLLENDKSGSLSIKAGK
jgi:HprK-related kinase B